MILIDHRCRRELDAFPLEIREDLADALARLDEGLNAFKKTSQQTPQRDIALARARIKELKP
jgi:hypothetical protein